MLSLMIVFMLFVVPSFSTGLNLALNKTDSDPRESVEIIDSNISDDSIDGSIELSLMFFTETSTTENSLYYVCRRGTDAIAYFGDSRVMYQSENHMVTLEFPGSRTVIPRGESPTGSVTNYLLGNDQTNWKTNIKDCAVLRYEDIYPGIDLVYKIQNGNLKYEFVVAPYADPSLIQMSYPSAEKLDVYTDSIIVTMSDFLVSDTGLVAIQGHEVYEVPSSFRRVDAHTIGFDLGYYEESQELIIDPLLVYSTYLGGIGEDRGMDIAVENGYAYVTGYTDSSTFPTYQAYDSTWGGNYDCFVTKIDTTTQSLIYSTYLGSSYDDQAYSIAVEDGYVYITGITYSATFPLVNAYDSTYSTGFPDAFLTKIAADGQSLIYSTFIGGSNADSATAVDVEDGYVVITGNTYSSDFPTINAFNATKSPGIDCFVTMFTPNGSSLFYSTFLGGVLDDIGYGIALENGFAYVTGSTGSSNFPTANAIDPVFNVGLDCFVTKLSSDGLSLVYSTFIGGTGTDAGNDIAAEEGFAYIAGYTTSSSFPVANAYQPNFGGTTDAFICKLAVDGQSFIYSTFLGTANTERANGIAVENDYVYLTGYTTSASFPVKNAYDSSFNGGYDCYVTKFSADGQVLVYSTYLGGQGNDYSEAIAVENSYAFITGETLSIDFPMINSYDITYGGFSNEDCFVAVLIDDEDMDGLSDTDELMYGTNPFCIDSDNDNYNDGFEIAQGSDPLDRYSYPGATSPSDYSIAYSSYMSGSGNDNIEAIQIEDGYIYLSGYTTSANFPMVNAWNSTYSSTRDVFIIKMSKDGQSIIFSTFVGGQYDDTVQEMVVYEGCVFIGGYTSSPNFPTYLAFDDSYGDYEDGFLFKLAADGALPVFSTFLGGSYTDHVYDLFVEDGFAYLTGQTGSTDFPTVNAYDNTTPTTTQSFLTKFAIDGQSLVYSTYLGGNNIDYGTTVAVENGNAYVGGYTLSSDFPLYQEFDDVQINLEGYLTKFTPDGRSIIFSTFIGGTFVDIIQAICVDRGFVFLTGFTSSDDFPMQNALYPTKLGGSDYSGFVMKVNTNVATLVYSTYLTGSSLVMPNAISVEESIVCISGQTSSTDFPITSIHTTQCDSLSTDAFVTKIAPDGQSLLYSTCIGGTQNDYSRSIDFYDGKMYIVGYTLSTDYPCFLAYDAVPQSPNDGFLTIFDIDFDCDSLPDFSEDIIGTDKLSIDTDNDNFLDSYEIAYGTDPTDAFSYPAIPQAWYDAIYEDLDGNATLIQNLIAWSDSNASLLETVMQQLDDNATLLTQVIAWLDSNHTAIQTLFTLLEGNATLLLDTVNALNDNSLLIQNLLTWSAGNETLLLNVIAQVNAMESVDISQVIAWLDGNHTAIQTLFTYLEGNATLLLSTIAALNENTLELELVATLISGNIQALNSLNASYIEDIDAIRDILDQLGISVGDADYDGLDDLDEIVYGTDILCIDTDCDNLNDAFEIKLGTDPLNDDSDGDSYLDGLEVIAGTDPMDALDYPGSTRGSDPTLIIVIVSGSGIAAIIVLITIRRMRKRH